MSDWIKCSDRMPPSYMPVKVKTLRGRTGVMYRAFRWRKAVGFGEFKISEVPGDMVTHWMPLPEPPEDA
ncbi:hypothetical protein CYR40_05775 [Chimaeribacter arupi]|uniref:DUF551 domain-containing protein n=1 Tax=Chimaeribacter arupi TaxID=2060066 RepID=UPI000C7CBCF0|nr:hypothetical protein CYR40_05775 [Chimaeribacter arupi]